MSGEDCCPEQEMPRAIGEQGPDSNLCRSIREFTLQERLKSRKTELEHQLEQVNSAIAFLEKNPEIHEFFVALKGSCICL